MQFQARALSAAQDHMESQVIATRQDDLAID
jgi:hypothetical protein